MRALYRYYRKLLGVILVVHVYVHSKHSWSTLLHHPHHCTTASSLIRRPEDFRTGSFFHAPAPPTLETDNCSTHSHALAHFASSWYCVPRSKISHVGFDFSATSQVALEMARQLSQQVRGTDRVVFPTNARVKTILSFLVLVS